MTPEEGCRKLVEAAVERARIEIEGIADAYRREVLVPLCRKRRLTFLSGNGIFTFYRKNGDSIAEWECERAGFPELTAVFAVLNTPALGRDDCLGFYVADIVQ